MTPALKESIVTYSDGEKTFEGVMVHPGHEEDKMRPAIVIAHDFLGLRDYQRAVARRLAEKGYVVLAADLYGQGVRPKSNEEANQLALSLREDVPTMRRRMMAAYQLLTGQPRVDSTKVVALGYSLGGLPAFELARGGAQLAGVVSIWGILETKRPEDKLSAHTKVLIFHGTLDPLSSAEAVTAFESELQRANIDYQLVKYGGVAHAFTVPAVGTDVSTGLAYDAKADRRSWAGLETFLKEVAPLE
jgi:dienelactone hydrolase